MISHPPSNLWEQVDESPYGTLHLFRKFCIVKPALQLVCSVGLGYRKPKVSSEERKVRFVCTRCQTTLSIPDETLPGKDLCGIKCAVCQERMEVEGESDLQGQEMTPLQLITASGRKMLVWIAEATLAERVAREMKGSDWRLVVAQDPAAALVQLENTEWDLVVLHARQAGPDLPENPVLHYWQRLPMPSKRASLLCLLCDETPTLDYMAAFRAGVNLVVNVQDLERLPSILNHMLKQHQGFYALFDDELRRRVPSSV
jgi:hypothetical protein